jgi:hypothetical protein
MALLPLATCARVLGIHPKTLHHWLKEANFPLAPHATDARIKCVAQEHLLEVARRHGRPLPDLPSAPRLSGCSAPGWREEQAKPLPTNEAEPDHPGASMPATSPPEADLIQKLSCLETKIVTLQEHLAQLALALLQERERSVERRLLALETVTAELVGKLVCSPSLPDAQGTGPLAELPGAPHAPADRIQCAGNLCDCQFAGRRAEPGTGFARVVRLARLAFLFPLCRQAWSFYRLPRLQARVPITFLEGPSPHPPAQLQALVGRY